MIWQTLLVTIADYTSYYRCLPALKQFWNRSPLQISCGFLQDLWSPISDCLTAWEVIAKERMMSVRRPTSGFEIAGSTDFLWVNFRFALSGNNVYECMVSIIIRSPTMSLQAPRSTVKRMHNYYRWPLNAYWYILMKYLVDSSVTSTCRYFRPQIRIVISALALFNLPAFPHIRADLEAYLICTISFWAKAIKLIHPNPYMR